MNQLSNVDAIYTEYPFLNKFLQRDIVLTAKVSRWNNKSIEKRYPFMKYTDDLTRLVGEYNHPFTSLCLLDINGTVIDHVGGSPEVKRFKWKPETVGQALSRLSTRASEVHFGLETAWIGRIVKNWRFKTYKCVRSDCLTIIKLPKNAENAQAWVEMIAEEGLKAVQEV